MPWHKRHTTQHSAPTVCTWRFAHTTDGHPPSLFHNALQADTHIQSPMASTWSELKAEGNKAYSEGDLDTAVAKYTAALQTDVAPADRATLLCNRAQCFLKQDKFSEAIEDCTACLAVAPENVKALFRR